MKRKGDFVENPLKKRRLENILPGPFFTGRDIVRGDNREALLVNAITTSIWPKQLHEDAEKRKEFPNFCKLKKMQQLNFAPKDWMKRFRKWAKTDHSNFARVKVWTSACTGKLPKYFMNRFDQVEQIEKKMVKPMLSDSPKEMKSREFSAKKNEVKLLSRWDENKIEKKEEKPKKQIKYNQSKLSRAKGKVQIGSPPSSETGIMGKCPICEDLVLRDNLEVHVNNCLNQQEGP